MKIAGYIADLLYTNECVVIPGLGGFLTRDHPAYIHPMKHYFKPPHREVVFNPMLRTNDGLLLNHIARSEQLPYQDAKQRLDKFVLKCLAVMDEGKKIHFRRIGSISLNKEKQLVFEPDVNQNYLPASFGLSGFVSPPVIRDDFQQRVEKVFSNPPRTQEKVAEPPRQKKPQPVVEKRMMASRRPGKIKRQLVIVGAAASLLFAAWGTMNYRTVQYYYDQYKGHAVILPFFYASPNEYVIQNLDKLPVESMIPPQDFGSWLSKGSKAQAGINDLIPAQPYQAKLDPEPIPEVSIDPAPNTTDSTVVTEILPPADTKVSDEKVVDEAVIAKPEISSVIETEPVREEVKPLQTTTFKRYHIIAGAFKEKRNAENLIEALKAKKFEATFAGQTSGGLWRVSYGGFDQEAVALQQLEAVKMNENKQAWLLVL